MTEVKDNVRAAAFTTRDAAILPLFAALTAVGSYIKIPLPISPVPMTLQTPMVLAAGMILGSRRGAAAMLLYMLMGLFGLPVFVGGGGLHSIFSPSFGFIVGFIPAAWAAGKVCELSKGWVNGDNIARASIMRCIAGVAAIAVYDIFGTAWLHAILNWYMGKEVSLEGSIMMAVAPFIVLDLLKLGAVVAALALITQRIRQTDIFRQ